MCSPAFAIALYLTRASSCLQISVLNGDKKMISAVDATPAGIS